MTHPNAPRELAYRVHDGLEVTLLWDAGSDTVSIDVVDERNDCSFSIPVAPGVALDAFNHPYVYAPDSIVLGSPRSLQTVATPE